MPYVTPPFMSSALTQPLRLSGISSISSDITVRHPTYEALYEMRIKCQDVITGQDAIKSKGDKYLPRLSGQSEDEYKKYLYRALFFSIGAKSLQALVGMATLKEPKIKAPPAIEQKYFDLKNNLQFQESFVNLLNEVLKQNQAAALVEWPLNGGDPYVVTYSALAPINWKYFDNEPDRLEFVIICENYSKRINRYSQQVKRRYRELFIDSDGSYKQRIIDEDGEQIIIPKVKGVPLTDIPFIPFHSRGIGFTDEPPLFLDIANINISHYLSSADLEHGRHFTGLPTPIITGANSDTPLHIGSNQFIVLPDKGAGAKYLEFTGQGLQSLEKALAEKQAMLASLSARLLDNSSKGSEATEAVKLRYLSETASLTTVVKTINVVFNMLYNIIADSMSENGSEISIALDTDFLSSQMSSTEMTALFDGYLSGAIDVGTLVYNLRSGQRLDPSVNDDQIKADIEKRTANANQSNTQQ